MDTIDSLIAQFSQSTDEFVSLDDFNAISEILDDFQLFYGIATFRTIPMAERILDNRELQRKELLEVLSSSAIRRWYCVE